MEEAERVQGLIVALGAADDDIETITRNGEAEWSVAFDGDTIVTLHLVADEARLVLTVPLGRPPEEQRLAAYETMLCYNMLWPETGGVRMGLGGPHGELVQIADSLDGRPLDGGAGHCPAQRGREGADVAAGDRRRHLRGPERGSRGTLARLLYPGLRRIPPGTVPSRSKGHGRCCDALTRPS